MIPAAAITEWSRQVPWPSVDQVEQDLLLSRLIVEIANDDYLGNELIFRGGTCLHKLVAPTPLRYSEDLDYVRTTSGGIREFTRAVTSIGDRLGMQVTTKIGKHPKIYLRAPFEAGSTSMKVKIEVNTFERSPARPLERTPYGITTSWFAGEAAVQTFAVEELVTTKIRALFQRSKGRDLFDLWMAVTHTARMGSRVGALKSTSVRRSPKHPSSTTFARWLRLGRRTTRLGRPQSWSSTRCCR